MFDLRKFGYMALGALLTLGLVFGGYAVLAQTDDEDATPEATTETEAPVETPLSSWGPGRDGRSAFIPDLAERSAELADALGITVEELQAAQVAARTAAIEQAVADGLLTQEQADQLLANAFGLRGGRGFHGDEAGSYLADALGIPVAELEAAQQAVMAAKIEALVADGRITQEQADMMAARQAVQSYFDREGVAAMIQEAYETAVDEALAAGAITQEQADLLLQNSQGLGGFGFDGGLRGGHSGPGGRGGHGGPGAMPGLPGFGG